MPKSGIYHIRNKVNGRVYIGSAVNLERRNHDHYKGLRGGYHGNSYLQRAWRKYGEEFFEFIVVELVDDVKDLIQREQAHLDSAFAVDGHRPYNICRVAGSVLGIKHSAEAIEKMAASKRGKPRDPAVVAKHAAKLRGRKKLAESIAKRTLSRVGFRHTDEVKARISAKKIGVSVHSEEWKAKMSALHRGKKMAPSHGLKLREAHRSLTVEQVAEIAARRKAGESYVDLAKAFNSTKDTIRNWCMREGLPQKNPTLTTEQVAEIKERHLKGQSYPQIAEAMGISEVTIWRKIGGKNKVSAPPTTASPDRPAPDSLSSHPEQLGLF